MHSVQLDTTQDVTVKDQCTIIIRYVTDKLYERVVSVISCTSTGRDIYQLLSVCVCVFVCP